MDPRVRAMRKELAKTGSKALVSLNKAIASVGQDIIRMNTDQLIAFAGWLETQQSLSLESSPETVVESPQETR